MGSFCLPHFLVAHVGVWLYGYVSVAACYGCPVQHAELLRAVVEPMEQEVNLLRERLVIARRASEQQTDSSGRNIPVTPARLTSPAPLDFVLTPQRMDSSSFEPDVDRSNDTAVVDLKLQASESY